MAAGGLFDGLLRTHGERWLVLDFKILLLLVLFGALMRNPLGLKQIRIKPWTAALGVVPPLQADGTILARVGPINGGANGASRLVHM